MNDIFGLSVSVSTFVVLLGLMVYWTYQRHLRVAAFWGILAAISFSIVTFSTAPRVLGFGQVSSKVEKFSERLDPKIPYVLVNSTRDGQSYILLLKEFGTDTYRYLRESTTPPEIFSLVNGKILAIQPK